MILVFSAFTENEGVSGRQEPDNEAASQTRPSSEDPGRKWVWDLLVAAASQAVVLNECNSLGLPMQSGRTHVLLIYFSNLHDGEAKWPTWLLD